jgi:polysaccharide biosynthesis/export protein ExoF
MPVAMRSAFPLMVAAMATGLSFAADACWARDLGVQRATAGTAPPVASRAATLGIGDKLKVVFFETIDISGTRPGDRAGGDAQGALRTFYQRMDLSGDYVIEPGGEISIPLLGHFAVEGRAVEAVRSDLAAAFLQVMGRPADVNVMVSERPPVYMVGAVRNPGAYKYVPGMIVLQAIALAGGHDRGEAGAGTLIESVREMERLHKAADQMRRLLARRVRLEAQRGELPAAPMPVQVAKWAAEPGVQSYLATEKTLLRFEEAKRQQQENEVATRISAARQEIEALERKLQQVDVQKDMRVERLSDLQKLRDRGVVTSNSIVTVRTELSDIESHREDSVVAMLQAQGRLAQAREAKARLALEEAEGIARAIVAVDQEIADTQEVIASAGALRRVLQGAQAGGLRARTYEILRQSRDGTTTVSATEMSALMPGDVVKVSTAGAISTAAAGASPEAMGD